MPDMVLSDLHALVHLIFLRLYKLHIINSTLQIGKKGVSQGHTMAEVEFESRLCVPKPMFLLESETASGQDDGGWGWRVWFGSL